MGCAASTQRPLTVPELTVRTLMLAQQRGQRLSQLSALAASSFLPKSTPAEILNWLDDPVILAHSSAPSDELEAQSVFELEVPESARNDASAKIPTTLQLPSGERVAVRRGTASGETAAACETMWVSIPTSALQVLGQVSVRTYHGEHELVLPTPPEDSFNELRAAEDGAPLRPLSLADLEAVCPRILPDDVPEALRGGESVCVVCEEPLDGGAASKMLPLRQLPCSHAYHLACIDPWLCKQDRSCPTCRTLVAPGAASSGDALSAGEQRLETAHERAWDNYVAMRASGAFAAIIRLNEMELNAEIRRHEQTEREWRASQGTFLNAVF